MLKVQVVGPGCTRCHQLGANASAALAELGVAFELEKVTDVATMVDMGIMVTPALVVNGAVRSSGKVLSVEEIKQLLS